MVNNDIFYWISSSILFAYIVILLPTKIYYYHKQLKLKEQTTTLGNIIRLAISSTIFNCLDKLTSENTAVSPIRMSQQSLRKQTSQDTITGVLDAQDLSEEYNGAVICDCYECFCDGWPWQIGADWTVFKFCKQYYDNLSDWLFQSMKYIAFTLINVLTYCYLPINNILGFTNNIIGVTIFGLICQTLQFNVLCFIFSFIGTRREMVRLSRNDGTQRALLIYYHIRKSWIFSFMTFLIMLIETFVLQCTLDSEVHEIFLVYNSCYQFTCYLLLSLIIRYNSCLKNDLIQDDDHILKAQQNLYTIQNNLIKCFPSEKCWFEYIQQVVTKQNSNNEFKEQVDKDRVVQDLEDVMQYKCMEAKQSLHKSIEAINKQKFKKIKKNLGVKKATITVLIIYLYINLALFIVISCVLCLQLTGQVKDVVDIGSIHDQNLIGYQILNVLQYTLFPILIGLMFDTKALLGQDYGEWTQLEQVQ